MNQIYLAFSFFVVTAVTVVYLGSKRLFTSKVRLGDVGMGDAVAMPIMGSVVLFSLFLAYKYLPKEIINIVISSYLSIGATYALTCFIKPYYRPRFYTGLICVGISMGYVYTHHWILNNILAFALGVVAIETISIGSFKTAYVLLALLFLYDIFWVFGTTVMISVASNIRGPVLLLFPQTLFGDHEKKSLLGLGDIVVPGLFISQTLIFSQKCVKRGNLYFIAALVAYACSLITTMAVMQIFRHGQPALLYIVPYLCITFALMALIKGDIKAAWNFDSSRYSEYDSTAAVDVDDSFVSSILQVVKEIFGFEKERKTRGSPRQKPNSSVPLGALRRRKGVKK